MKSFTARLIALFSLLTLEVLVVSGVFMVSGLLFFYLTRIVFVENSMAFDQWAFGKMDVLRAAWPSLTTVVESITFFASLPFLVVVGLGLPLVLRLKGHRREGLEILLAVAGASILNQLMKTHFQRMRPETALFPQSGLSFPSGHSMIGLALYGCIAWVLWRHEHHPAWAALLLMWAVLIGLTRVYLHVHYATDVLAGFAIALVWLILLRTALRLWWREAKVIQ
ncbi:undecaprenyl-diphosphatase [Hymenobacter gelipurpurascens]|uniref:Undecaprenyl-diphosphatase n=1 Tax=Hymenobacter gelipurpurascens TaxID=89968 RepID=A0A212TMG1_9BACT|nr:phosphatase PAP2 family protein [Hymenobacter gelipurpurascens]SNC67165.1 undecaprenyl-diphosphatase [Hymenobacter gelipurpurascens]